MSTTDDYQVPVRDGRSSHPQHTAPEEMYWLSHLDQSELTEKYVSLRDNFYTLKKYSTKQEDKIKKMQTKLRKITSDRNKDGVGLGVRSVKEVEYEETVEVQRHALRELRSRNQHLEKKLKLANVQLSTARKNKPLMFRHVGPRVDSGLKPCRSLTNQHTKPTTQSNPSPHMMFSSPSEESSPLNSATSPQHRPEEVLPGRVREILEEARERILALEAERDDLQEQLNEKQQSVEAAEYELQQRAGELEEEVAALRGELRAHSQREEREAVAAVRAGRETRALTARCTALTEQLAATEEKVAVERTTRADLNADLEKTTSRLLSTETKLRESQEELQKVSSKLQQITEKKNVIESENVQLQRENERLTSLTLSSEPRELSSENEALKAQVAHLEAALQTDLSERGNFLEQLTRDKEAVARMEVEVKKLKGKNLSLQEELEKATHKLDIYKKAGLETVTKEAMMASQHKKEEGITALSSKEYDVLRESHSELQLLYRERTHELETMTNTITTHSSTYETLQNQVERVTHEAEERERELRISIRELQEMLVRREERCERLEAQVLAHCEGDQGLDPTLDHLTQDKDRQLTQTLDLGRHDNLLEFHIAGMTFEAVDLGRLKTFVSWTVPFALKDPLQHTNVAVGSPARYSHSSLYSFHMSHRNLESLRQDTISVSVYRLLDSGHPTKVGECRLSFSVVLDHPRNTLHGTAPVMLALDHPNDVQHFAPAAHMLPGQVIGTMSYWFRLERPCEDVIAQYLHSVNLLAHHQKKQEQISQTPKIVKSTTPMKRDASRDKDRLIQMPTSVINEDKEKDREDSRRDTEINKEVGSKNEKMEAVAVERESKKSVMVGVVPVPAPRSQAPPLSHSPDGNNTTTLNIQRHTRGNQVTQHECENDKVDHESRNTDSQKLADEAERDEKVVIGETSLQQRRSRSNSVTSTGTYNIGSPQQRQRSSDSGDDSESSANLKLEKKIRRGSSSPAVHSNLSREGKVSPVVSTRATRPKSAIPPKQENSSSVQSSGSSSSRSKMGIQQMHGKSPSVHQIVESSNDIDEKEDTGTLEDESSEEEDIVVVKDRDSYHTSQQHMEDQTVIRVTSGGKGSRKESRSISSQDSNNTRKKGGGRSEHIRRKEGIYSSTGIRHRTEKQHHHQSSTESESSTSRSSKRLEAEDHHITTDESYQDSDSEGVVAIPSTSHKEEKLNVYVEVCSLMLAPTTTAALAEDPLVDLLFIDYHGFLGLPPDRLETPLSLPKPTKPHTPLNFNFGQELCVDPDQYPERWSALGDLMKGRGLLKFTVTSEPPPHLQDSQDCNDIGYVYVDMHGLAESEEDLDEVQLPVESAEDGRHLGSLTVTLHITHVLKHLYNA